MRVPASRGGLQLRRLRTQGAGGLAETHPCMRGVVAGVVPRLPREAWERGDHPYDELPQSLRPLRALGPQRLDARIGARPRSDGDLWRGIFASGHEICCGFCGSALYASDHRRGAEARDTCDHGARCAIVASLAHCRKDGHRRRSACSCQGSEGVGRVRGGHSRRNDAEVPSWRREHMASAARKNASRLDRSLFDARRSGYGGGLHGRACVRRNGVCHSLALDCDA